MAGMAVTYKYPVAGAVAPTAAQAKDEVVADIAAGAGANDDDTDITHNFGCAEADGSKGSPQIGLILTAQGVAAKVPTITFKDANTITVVAGAKGATCDFTARVTIKRPHSVGR